MDGAITQIPQIQSMMRLLETVVENSTLESLGNGERIRPTGDMGSSVIDQVAHENNIETVLDQTNTSQTDNNKCLNDRDSMYEHSSGTTRKTHDNSLSWAAMKWAQDATLDKATSAHDSESFTVLPPLIEPHRNVRLSVLNERLNEPMESQKTINLES